jgi:hypothetical protein
MFATAMLRDRDPLVGSTTPTVTSIFILILLEPATALPLLVVMVPGMTDMTITDDPERVCCCDVGWRLSDFQTSMSKKH